MRSAVLFEQGRPPHRYALEDANEAFRALAAGGLGRGVIVL